MSKKLIVIILSVVVVVIVIALKYDHKQEFQSLQKGALGTANLVQGIIVSSEMKMASQEIFEATGEMPHSNAQAGLLAPDYYSSQSLKTAHILPNGTIELVYKDNSGVDGGIIRFIPTVVQGTIEWSCETPDYQQVYNLQCKYIGH